MGGSNVVVLQRSHYFQGLRALGAGHQSRGQSGPICLPMRLCECVYVRCDMTSCMGGGNMVLRRSYHLLEPNAEVSCMREK